MEYLILTSMVVLACLGIVKALGQTLKVQLTKVARGLGAEVEGPVQLPRISDAQLRQAQMRQFLLSRNSAGRADVEE
jgi:hypothetical protein